MRVLFVILTAVTRFYNRIDSMLALEKMPKEYNNWYSQVYCNDCESKCPAKYHFMYHKCLKCEGYNTKVIDILKSQDLVNREDLIKIETLRNKIQSKVFGQHKECKDVS